MKKTTLFLSLFLLAACQGTTTDKAAEQDQAAVQKPAMTEPANEAGKTEKPAKPQKPSGKLPAITIYEGRSYDDKLQKELDERNRRHQDGEAVMTLVDAVSGEDSGTIYFKDAEGEEWEFASWPYEAHLKFDLHDEGDKLAKSEKGKKYYVTYGLRAYWFDSEGGVVEKLVVKKMERVK
jgi:uncharacterized protein YcfL